VSETKICCRRLAAREGRSSGNLTSESDLISILKLDNSCTVSQASCSWCYSNTCILGKREPREGKAAPVPKRCLKLLPAPFRMNPVLRAGCRRGAHEGSGARTIEREDTRDTGAPVRAVRFRLRYPASKLLSAR